jgi:heat shock protein HslJ
MIIADSTEWVLAGGEGQALVFEDGRIAGFGGVNRYAGEYTLEGEELRLGPLAVTRMAGPPEAMESERRYLDALGRAARAAVDEGTLVLADGDGSEFFGGTRRCFRDYLRRRRRGAGRASCTRLEGAA